MAAALAMRFVGCLRERVRTVTVLLVYLQPFILKVGVHMFTGWRQAQLKV